MKTYESVLNETKCIYDRQSIEDALDRLADVLNAKFSQVHPLVLCVLHGGLIFSGHLLPRLRFPLQQDYVHATRYRGMQQGCDQLQWIAKPHSSVQARSILLLDDIYDEGHTLNAIKEQLLYDGAKSVYSAVLLKKNHPRGTAELEPDFIALEVEDRYVFGFGMDYEHQWRHLNGIYTLVS